LIDEHLMAPASMLCSSHLTRSDAMSTFKLTFGMTARILGAVGGLSIATPAPAQEVIYEPAYCAQYYPNANCQNMGPGNPNDIHYPRRAVRNAEMAPPGGIALKRPRKHHAASSAARRP
jgi:hypothetical protein